MSDGNRPSLRAIVLSAGAIVAAAFVGTGGCSHSSAVSNPGHTVSPTPIPSGSPTASPSPTPTANVFVSMAYASASPTIDPTYGEVDGYALIAPPPTPTPTPSGSPAPSPSPTPTETPGPSGIINVPCNTNIQFLNFDKTQFLTASVLPPDTGAGGFPTHFDNVNGPNPSPILTPISFPGLVFSSGLVSFETTVPGRSAVYSTGPSNGVFFIGDVHNYDMNPSMRTVIVVTGC